MLAAVAFSTGETKKFLEAGDFFRILSAGAVVDLLFFKNGQIVADAPGINPGYSEKFSQGFDAVQIKSDTAQTVQFVIRLGNEVSYDGAVSLVGGGMQVTGEVAITQGTTVTDLAPVVVGVAATQLVSLDTTRKGLRFTNASNVDVYIGGAGVTVANGAVKVTPSGTWVEDEGARAAWYGIAGTAGNNIKIQEIR